VTQTQTAPAPATTDWLDTAEPVNPYSTPKLGVGIHEVTVKRVVFASNDGTRFTSKWGHEQVMLILAADNGHEAPSPYFVTPTEDQLQFPERSVSRFLAACGANLAKYREKGVKPSSFLDETFGSHHLMGSPDKRRRLKIEIKSRQYKDKQGNQVTEWTLDPILPGDPRGQLATTTPALTDPEAAKLAEAF
jgi:hypothetical protein